MELNFILLKTDGTLRCGLLGIKRYHYIDKAKAAIWYEALMKEATDCSEEAIAKLKKIYEIMTYH